MRRLFCVLGLSGVCVAVSAQNSTTNCYFDQLGNTRCQTTGERQTQLPPLLMPDMYEAAQKGIRDGQEQRQRALAIQREQERLKAEQQQQADTWAQLAAQVQAQQAQQQQAVASARVKALGAQAIAASGDDRRSLLGQIAAIDPLYATQLQQFLTERDAHDSAAMAKPANMPRQGASGAGESH